MDSKQLLEMVVKAADGRRAEDIVALKVDEISPMADYFVIMTGGSDRQVQAITNAIVEKAHEENVKIGSVEGKIMLNGYWLTLVTWLSMFSVKKLVNSITLKIMGRRTPCQY